MDAGRKRKSDQYSYGVDGVGRRPVDAVALKNRKLEREALQSSGHKDEKGSLLTCKLCDAVFTQPMSLQKHARQKHKEERGEMGEQNVRMYKDDSSLQCSHCGIYFSSQVKLEYHLSYLMEAAEKPRRNEEKVKQEVNVKMEPTIDIKVEPDTVFSIETKVKELKVKSEPNGVKLEEHACSDCDFRTFVRLEFMDHVLYDCSSDGESVSTSQPQEMGEGWSFKSGTFFCLKCKFTTKQKKSMFGHVRNVHSTN
eukprot:GFUD01003370.1.p1 GENE.GFUD01003370.1~~GFUD01003370.1.p1  ORF type:complete len:253 (-),score=56.42 GFUD01003370.1:116-874(-)